VGEFYTFEGALALREEAKEWAGGRLVVHITEMPIKCPVAPLEFTFLADDWLRQNGLRDKTELIYVTPLDGAFTKPVASRELGDALSRRGVTVETDFMIERVDQERKVIVSFDEREVPYDQLVTIPLNMGADYVARSGLGDELNYVPVDKHTMQSTAYENIFALGDAGNLPTSKAGSVAHFSIEIFVDNFMQLISGAPMTHSFDGHANCFIESGNRKGMLLDFNYDTEPLTGTFPVPKVGPMSLLKESYANHLGKLAFRHIYWNVLLPGRPLGLPSEMKMTGKNPVA
jgi:sulfide:quinone oxidoreductase